MADSTEKAKKKRGIIRGSTTRICNRAKCELEKDSPNLDLLEELHVQLEEKERLLKELDKAIEDGTENLEELETEVTAAQEYLENTLNWKTRLSRVLQRKQSSRNGSEERSAERSPTPAPAASLQNMVRLPRLSIAKFSGDVTAWQSFWSHFDSAFHQNQGLTKIDKFNYLSSLLEGTAASAVSGLTLSNENYDTAVRILKERFGKRELVISAHVNKLLSLSPVKRANDLVGLRKFYDSCEIQIRSLEAAGIELNAYGNLLYPILIRLIPEEITLEYNRRRSTGDHWNVSSLLEFLKNEIESRESTSLFNKIGNEGNLLDMAGNSQFANKQKSNNFNSHSANGGNRQQNRLSSAAALSTSTTSGSQCLFCENGTHKSEECELSISDRKAILKRRGMCFRCVEGKHMARFCRSKLSCRKCNRRHNVLMCEGSAGKPAMTEEVGSDAVVSSVTQGFDPGKMVLLQTACAFAVSKKQNLAVRCLLDGGSQRTFVSEDISRKLNLEVVGEEYLSIHSFGADAPTKVKRRRVILILQNPRHPDKRIQIEAVETPKICGAIVQVPGREIQEYFSSKGWQLADTPSMVNHSEITVLIGADYYWTIVKATMKRISDRLVALETVFGWTVHGPTASTATLPVVEQSVVGVMKVFVEEQITDDELTSKTIQKFWELEAIGVVDDATEDFQTDKETLVDFESSLQFKNGRYEVQLPWRNKENELPDNHVVASRRFQGLVKRFKNDPHLYFRYKEVIDNYLDQGIAERVLRPDDTIAEHKTFYLPHQAVIRDDKATSKLRVVFDASSHAHDAPSLNDCLIPGPNLNPDVMCLLLKFRMNSVAFVADIEQAFLQISLVPEDRDAVRFLWIDGVLEPDKQVKLQTLRMTRVLFGVTSSPFLLAATVKAHAKKYSGEYPEACRMLQDCLYVDDLIGGADNERQAQDVSTDIKTILKEAGMNMRKWHTNSKELRNMWSETNHVTDAEVQIMAQNVQTQKVLGLVWRSSSDVFSFDASNLLEFLTTQKNTKRTMLQATGRIYDPIGFLTPFTIRSKINFQKSWINGVNWDDPLPEDLQREWETWCSELPMLNSISIPRYYFADLERNEIGSIQLHCFTDASEKAYGAALYLRFTVDGKVFNSILVSSKSRVAPIKKISLPRLELMGALLGSRLASHVKGIFEDHFKVSLSFWTDSTIVLFWIKGSTTHLKPFVQFRTKEIQEKSEASRWRHCPGTQNPADILTRGVKLKIMSESETWWKGPAWLRMNEEAWPENKFEDPDQENVKEETRKAFKIAIQSNCVAEVAKTPLLELSKFSSLSKLLRITAWISRFCYNSRHPQDRRRGEIAAVELSAAENYWIRETQRETFLSEIERLEAKRSVSTLSRIFPFNPYLDEAGILRVGGRLQHSELSFQHAHPIILPDKGEFSGLVIRRSHVRVGHAGVDETLTEVRDRFWVLRCRQRIKSVINKCNLCKRFRARPMTQDVAPLPPERVSEAPPFEICGVDFAGPLYVKTNNNNTDKSYIVLFTCAVTRAVHLELVTDMSAETFMLAFKRFISRRGICKVIFSDNAKTFKKTDRDLRAMWKNLKGETLKEYFGKTGITWKFIVEKAAWWGGFYERLIRSVKTCLKKILGRASLDFQSLQTVLTEVEAILNSRPLTFTYSDPSEPSPLTPGHFLIGKRLTSLPSDLSSKRVLSTKSELTRRIYYRQTLTNGFWKRWRESYLLNLRSAYQTNNGKATEGPKENSVVLICDDKQPRLLWKTGVVTEKHVGRDGKVRSCSIRLSGGNVIRRPIQLICPLELEGATCGNLPLLGGGC